MSAPNNSIPGPLPATPIDEAAWNIKLAPAPAKPVATQSPRPPRNNIQMSVDLVRAKDTIKERDAMIIEKDARIKHLEAMIENLKNDHAKKLADTLSSHQAALDKTCEGIQASVNSNSAHIDETCEGIQASVNSNGARIDQTRKDIQALVKSSCDSIEKSCESTQASFKSSGDRIVNDIQATFKSSGDRLEKTCENIQASVNSSGDRIIKDHEKLQTTVYSGFSSNQEAILAQMRSQQDAAEKTWSTHRADMDKSMTSAVDRAKDVFGEFVCTLWADLRPTIEGSNREGKQLLKDGTQALADAKQSILDAGSKSEAENVRLQDEINHLLRLVKAHKDTASAERAVSEDLRRQVNNLQDQLAAAEETVRAKDEYIVGRLEELADRKSEYEGVVAENGALIRNRESLKEDFNGLRKTLKRGFHDLQNGVGNIQELGNAMSGTLAQNSGDVNYLVALTLPERPDEHSVWVPSKRARMSEPPQFNEDEDDLPNVGPDEFNIALENPAADIEDEGPVGINNPPPLSEANLDRLCALNERGDVVEWADLSDAVKDALRNWLGGYPDWYGKLIKSRGKSCVGRKSMALHIEKKDTVACKQCAFQHTLCVKKYHDRPTLTPLCDLDRPAPSTIADVSYFRLPDTVYRAPSSTAKPKVYNAVS